MKELNYWSSVEERAKHKAKLLKEMAEAKASMKFKIDDGIITDETIIKIYDMIGQ